MDRLLSNKGIEVWQLFGSWVPFVVGDRQEIVAAPDWTEYDADDQSTLALSMITAHGRATPLLWKTVVKSEMKGQRSAHEDALLERFREVLPQGVKATILADRGFADQAMYELLKDQLGFDFVVRFRSIAPHQLAGSPRPPALVSGIAIALLTMLGAAGEAIGIDKYLKTNAVRRASGR